MKTIPDSIKQEFKNKTILISGGTGSIGLGIIKQLIPCKPKLIKILTNDENSIFETRRTIGENPLLKYMVGDVRDKERLQLAIRNVDIVFHAAAMKHIDICEQNPFDAVKTNVFGTSNILEAAIIEQVSKFIFISTDKATNPTSTLGASKLLAERLILDASSYNENGKTIFAIARFGNVIGSRGSVFQIFYHNLRNGDPLTITDARMTRFIMSISEAASMILQMTRKAKDGDIFILKMPSVKISDLARAMVNVYNERYPNMKKISTVKISTTREHERFHEILVTSDEVQYCHDVGNMYKISKTENKQKLTTTQFSSETASTISNKKLHNSINELLDEYVSF